MKLLAIERCKKMNKKRLLVLIPIILISLLMTGCGQTSKGESLQKNPDSKTEFLLGTVVSIKIYDENKESALDAAFNRIKALDEQISVEKYGTEVNEINENAGIKPVKVSKDIYKLIESGKNHSQLSNGQFDISVGPLTQLWHIGFPDARKPKQKEINQVLPLIDYNNIELNQQNQTVYLTNKGMKLDLGAIAKGFITDEVVTVLEKANVTSAIVDLGGNIYALGKSPSNEQWLIGIQDPFSSRGNIIGKIQQENKSVVTSGIYERYLEVDDVKYHHLLNPKDGYPFNNDIAGVTIITNLSTDADALSTAVFSKGIQEGLKYIEQFEEAEAIFIDHHKNVYLTPGLKGEFELTNDQFTLKE